VMNTDDACQACAKASCCSDYQACAEDLNCSCLVGYLYNGGTADACASADACGSPSSVSISTAACLNGSCSGQCVSMGGMGIGTSMCPNTGAGGGSPSCQAIQSLPGGAACLNCAATSCCNAYTTALAGDPSDATMALVNCWLQRSIDASTMCSPPPASAGKVASFNACMFEACLVQCNGDPYAGDAGP